MIRILSWLLAANKPKTASRRPSLKPAFERLEDRTVPAAFTLSTGTGDGGVTVGVDGFGSFGTNVGTTNATDAIYNPVGALGAAGTSYISSVAIRFGTSGGRTFLTSGDISGTGNLPNPTVTGTATKGTSTFTRNGLAFTLVQTVTPTFSGTVRTGSMLTQTYTIRNTTTGTQNFELVRYLDGWLRFDGSLIDGGGHIIGPPEYLFETDTGGSATTPTTFVGTSASGGKTLTSNRFTFDYYVTVVANIVAGGALDDTVNNDGDGDGFVDSGQEFDPAQGFRNVFTLTAGATTTYVTRTRFGTGTPNDAVTFSGQIKVYNPLRYLYNSLTNTYEGTFTLVNIGTFTIPGPIGIIFNKVPAGVTVVGVSGYTPQGKPYILTNASLAPGQTLKLLVKVKNPLKQPLGSFFQTQDLSFFSP